MGHSLTGGHSFLLPGCGMMILLFLLQLKYQLLVLTWGSYLHKYAECQSQKGCCWKQDLETFFGFPVSVWGWACACVIFLFF